MNKDAANDPRQYGLYQDLPREHGFEPLRIEGKIPEDLSGTLYRNGPSLFSSFGERYRQFPDGDGAVSAVRFANGNASGAVRVVQSKGLVEERVRGKRIYGTYGTPCVRLIDRILGKIKNGSNTSVLHWQGRIYALFENGFPTELTTDDLQTIGEQDLGGVVIQTFTAHPHKHPTRNSIINFGVRYGPTTQIDLFEIPDDGSARRLGSFPISAGLVHDFCVTEKHAIFFIPSMRFQLLKQMLGFGVYADNFKWRPDLGTEVMIVPLDNPSKFSKLTIDASFQWHFVNAYEEGDNIIIDRLPYPDFDSTNLWFNQVSHGDIRRQANGNLMRTIINTKTNTATSEKLWERSCEFPTINNTRSGLPYRYGYINAHTDEKAAASVWYDKLVKWDFKTDKILAEISLGENHYPAEGIFAPSKHPTAEDSGYILTLVFDAISNTSYIAILDAQKLEEGPLARAWFDHHIPVTFHGIWVANQK